MQKRQLNQMNKKRAVAPAVSHTLQRAAINSSPVHDMPPIVHEVLRSPGQSLDSQTRAVMEPRFAHDFSGVRVHTDAKAAQSARAVNALAYTVGHDMVFNTGQYAPHTNDGHKLLAHELTHVVQQRGKVISPVNRRLAIDDSGEADADRSAETIVNGGTSAQRGQARPISIQRKVEMRDVGKGEQSGFARLPDLINRLNAMSQGLTYSLNGKELAYEIRMGGTLNGFDQQMMGFIDQDAVIPLRLTNRHGLWGDRITGFHKQIDVDEWRSGYVDIDDLLASTDLGLQSALVHFLRERTATSNYARRIGSPGFGMNEFNRVHALGIEAETELLRDYFGDPTIRIFRDAPSPTVRREFRNSRRDIIQRRVQKRQASDQGVDAMSIVVITRDGKLHTAEEYRRLLEEDRITGQIERELFGGAAEYRVGPGSVPLP